MIATNTTITRDAVQGLAHADEAGGLSGSPVLALSNRVIAGLKQELGTQIPIIGVGGILSGADAQAKIAAGASLVELGLAAAVTAAPAAASIGVRTRKRCFDPDCE